MRSDTVIRIAGEAVYTILMASGPMLLLALLVGLAISIFQATTQIQEQTLAFVPKIIVVFVSLIFFGPWILSKLVDFTFHLLDNLHKFVG
jgi:flagellar biosynthetic protein FliQ